MNRRSSSFDQFLNGYEERFLYLLEERDMITELAMLEEVVMMSKILAHLPIHDARTTYLLCMALQTQHFLASVLLSESTPSTPLLFSFRRKRDVDEAMKFLGINGSRRQMPFSHQMK